MRSLAGMIGATANPECVRAMLAAGRTGDVGDGKSFVEPVDKVYRIRSG